MKYIVIDFTVIKSSFKLCDTPQLQFADILHLTHPLPSLLSSPLLPCFCSSF